jgi:Tripartite tricarboxylate transporter family receptor
MRRREFVAREECDETSTPSIPASGSGVRGPSDRVAHRRSAEDVSHPARAVYLRLSGRRPNDIATRVMADWLSADLGQQFVVENRGGSGGNLGTQAMINSPRDGYTLLLVAANNAISSSLYKRLPFDFIRDTVPVAGVMRFTNVMVVPPSLPVQTVSDFIAYAKANPGKVSFASSGNGTANSHVGRIVQVDDRDRHGSRAVSRKRGRLSGPDDREGPRAVRQSSGID